MESTDWLSCFKRWEWFVSRKMSGSMRRKVPFLDTEFPRDVLSFLPWKPRGQAPRSSPRSVDATTSHTHTPLPHVPEINRRQLDCAARVPSSPPPCPLPFFLSSSTGLKVNSPSSHFYLLPTPDSIQCWQCQEKENNIASSVKSALSYYQTNHAVAIHQRLCHELTFASWGKVHRDELRVRPLRWGSNPTDASSSDNVRWSCS